ncbi:MAG: hypothetical protein NTW29_15170 [Bacteroidetes bacterium]|nr:hypothetical protein [Bacteroidota bacterium]
MKKLWLTCIAACTGLLLFAQNTIWNYTPGQTKSDQLFNVVNPTELRHRFIVELDKGNRMEILVYNREHFLKLMNIDSIIQLVNRSITMINDSLAPNELASRRIDIHIDPAGTIKIRTRVYPPPANHYMIQKNELSALKMEQDTIMVTGLMSGPAERIGFKGIYTIFPYRIMFVLNNYQQLNSYETGSLTGIMEQIRSEWNVHYPQTDKANRRFNLYGYYSLTDPSRTRRLSRPTMGSSLPSAASLVRSRP